MKHEERKDFDKLAAGWDSNPLRKKLAEGVAGAIIREMALKGDDDVLDFGCGTGLVTLKLQPLVKTITGIDTSQAMLDVLEQKVNEQGLDNVRTQFVDLEKGDRIEGEFSLIVSSMTLHHVPEPVPLLKQFHELLAPGGRLGIADLDAEDGSFHPDNTGIFHHGFERARVQEYFGQAGFHDARAVTATKVVREGEEGGREYPVFLIAGRK